MTFNAQSYLLVIPPRSSVILEFYYPFHYIALSNPLSTFYETPFYGISEFPPLASNTTYEIGPAVTATLTVRKCHLSESGFLKAVFGNGTVLK